MFTVHQTKAASVIAASLLLSATAHAASAPQDIAFDARNVHPESITSDAAGALYTGSMNGIIYRALPGATKAVPFIKPDATNGLKAVFGVLADARSRRLYVCTVTSPFGPPPQTPPPPSAMVAFELPSGRYVGRWEFPAPGGVCNDIAVAKDGAVYATDTPGGRILKLVPGAKSFTVAAQSDALKFIDGIVFDTDGTLYVNIVTTGQLLRVDLGDRPDNAVITTLQVDRKLEGPDGLRPLGTHRFVQAEGTSGRITTVTIDGDKATIGVLREGLNSSPGVTVVGNTVYAIEGKIGYLANPALRGQDPGEFKIYAIPLK